ncbi:MAG: calcium-binding protein [Arenibacterium sp.]
MLTTEVFDPFFFSQPAQDGISGVLVTSAKQGSFSVNGAATRVTWLPFAGSQYELIFKGTGLGVQNGALSAGQIASIEASRIQGGAQIISVTDLDQRAQDLQDQIDQTIEAQSQAGETDLWAAQFLRGLLFDPEDQDVTGSDFDDLLSGGNGNDRVDGGDGNDIVVASMGRDALSGGNGSNTLRMNTADFTGEIDFDMASGTLKFANAPNQTATGFQNAEGGGYNDTLTGDEGPNVLTGNAGNDFIRGNGGNDTIRGGTGIDDLFGGAGNDLILGGEQGDTIQGNSGDDELFGESGNDKINGNSGRDLIEGGAGEDDLFGDGGRDKIKGGAGNDIIKGGKGNDVLRGGNGSETGRFDVEPGLVGGGGNDRIFGGSKADFISGGNGNDTIFGESGRDLIEGDSGRDVIFGGSGNDSIDGGKGDDEISGGGGTDNFYFDAKTGEGSDRITDFEQGETIFIVGQDENTLLFGTSSFGQFLINHDGGTIDLVGVQPNDVTVRMQVDTTIIEYL